MKLFFLDIQTSVKSKLNQLLSAFSHRRPRKERMLEIEDGFIEEEDEEQHVSTQFL